MYSDMSMRTIACSSSNRNAASALVSSVLPTPVGPEEHERADRPVRVLQAGARAAHGGRHRVHGLLLADDALARARPPCAAACRARLPASCRPECRSSATRPARCARRSPPPRPCRRALPCASASFSLLLELGNDAIGQFAGALAKSPLRCAWSSSVRASSSSSLSFCAPAELVLLRLPARGERRPTSPRARPAPSPASASRSLEAVSVSFFSASRSIFSWMMSAVELVELLGLGIDLHAQARRRLVHQVDGLVGQEAVGDVAVRQRRRRDDAPSR